MTHSHSKSFIHITHTWLIHPKSNPAPAPKTMGPNPALESPCRVTNGQHLRCRKDASRHREERQRSVDSKTANIPMTLVWTSARSMCYHDLYSNVDQPTNQKETIPLLVSCKRAYLSGSVMSANSGVSSNPFWESSRPKVPY